MLARRVIACLDVKDGRVVKGRNFRGLVDCGDPVELATKYAKAGIDELVVLDVHATLDGRAPRLALIEHIAAAIDVPFAVGGGIRSLDDALALLRAGADKVTLNSLLHEDPSIAARLADRMGRQAVVASIDAQRASGGGWALCTRSATVETSRDAVAFAEEIAQLGSGELLVTSVDRDGTRDGYDLELLAELRARVTVPIIASGGAGEVVHLVDALRAGADAVLVASLLHFEMTTVTEIKKTLAAASFEVRDAG